MLATHACGHEGHCSEVLHAVDLIVEQMTLCVVAVGDSACETKLMSFVGLFLQVIRLPCYGQRETHFGTCRSMRCVWAS